jgi:glycosyltransferase involved in cell wall biosynthesis
MNNTNDPLVSVVTPVYNGEKYLAECIESVVAQTYKNWEYAIVNNCSTDRTREIAERYARMDNRIKVYNYEEFVDAIQNHNRALRLISPHSKHCKIVSADDWIYPECIERLVEVAEGYPSVGIVGSYAVAGTKVRGIGLPLKTNFFSGREVCRLRLLGANVIGSPTSLLYRADVVRNEKAFFPGSAPHVDIAACFRTLQYFDYGYVHQILSFERVHEESASSGLRGFNPWLVDRIEFLVTYGKTCLTPEEFEKQMEELLAGYYEYLAVEVVNFRISKYWDYYKNRMHGLGLDLSYSRIAKATIWKLLDLLLNPKQTIEKILRRIGVQGR